MASTPDIGLLAKLAKAAAPGEEATWATLAAKQPEHDRPVSQTDTKLNQLLDRINGIVRKESPVPAEAQAAKIDPEIEDEGFVPLEPTSFREARLAESEVEGLALKFLMARGDASGREIADQVKLPFVLLDELLRKMKNDQLVVHRASAQMGDYQYQLTDLGRERARRLAAHCSYFGSAPVSLTQYIESVKAQSLATQQPNADSLRGAFDGLLLGDRMLDRLGPAVNSGRGLFLYGAPGNGKTSIAQRITAAFGQHIWVPRAIGIDGEIIRLYDPVNHEEMPLQPGRGLLDQTKIDKRWIRIRRPTIIAGGELTMSALEVTLNSTTGISEAPLQLKSNCGTLVIDDFGRQRISTHELLNRWIVPLEMRIDFLNLPNGKKITVPFDQLIVFSTNLEPRDLVDEAFLRRVPYKIEVLDPTIDEFRNLFVIMAEKLGFPHRPEVVEYVIEKHYTACKRPFRFCQPRDLLLQVKNYCQFHKQPLDMTREYFDLAVENYFAVM